MRAVFSAWRAEGGDPGEIAASYALLVSSYSLRDPDVATLDLLAAAWRDRERLADPQLRRGLLRRLLGTLVVEGRTEQALALFDRAAAEGADLSGVTREDLDLARSQQLLARREERPVGTVRFSLPEVEPGDRFLVSPGDELPPDGAYRAWPPFGGLEIERPLGFAPVRWVLASADGGSRASGTVWPLAGRAVEVRVAARPASRPAPSGPPAPREPDGRRRVFVVVLDCADWRLVRYLDSRGDLPVFRRLLAAGHTAVLDSDPPYTAVAVEALARPQQQGVGSFAALVHQLGVEIAGLNFVGANPFAPLRWLLPPGEDLFATLGAGHLVTANLLRSFGALQVGRQAELVGPGGQRRRVAGYRGSRPLSADELAAVPGLSRPPRENDGLLLQEMAADFDTAEAIVDERSVDLLLLRVASLDLLTHGHFAASLRSGQDDGEGFLYDVYRYVDRRIGDLERRLDGDDVLVVLSDHGIRTAFEHDRHCLFVAVGAAVPPGRTPGRPGIRGVGRMLADLLGVETAWPATGIEAWVEELPPAGG